jgi:hypothetical protein
MNVWVNPITGRRNREFRPRIEEEEQANSVYLYNPEGPGFYYGLYQQAQPSCGSWVQLFNQYPSHTPQAVISESGRMHRVKSYGKGYCYNPLIDNVYPAGYHNNCN